MSHEATVVATPSGSAQHGAVMSHEGPEPSDWAGLAEIYTIHSFAPLSNLIFFVKILNLQKKIDKFSILSTFC